MNGSRTRQTTTTASATTVRSSDDDDDEFDVNSGEIAQLQRQRSDVAQKIAELHSNELKTLTEENHALKRLVQELREQLTEKSGEIVLLSERLAKKEHYIRNELKYIKKAALKREKERKGRSKKSRPANGDTKTRRRKEKGDEFDEARIERLHHSLGDLGVQAEAKGRSSSASRSKSNPRPDYSPTSTPAAVEKSLKRSESTKTARSHKSESSLNLSSLQKSSSKLTEGVDEQPVKPKRKRRVTKKAKSSSAIATNTSLATIITPAENSQVEKAASSRALNTTDTNMSETRQDAGGSSDLPSAMSNVGDGSPKKKSKRKSRKAESASKPTKPSANNESQPKDTGSNGDPPSESTEFGSYLSPRQLNAEKDSSLEFLGRPRSPDSNVMLPLELSPHLATQKPTIPDDSHEFMRQELSTENSFNSSASHSSSESFHKAAAAPSMLGTMHSRRTMASDEGDRSPALDPSSSDGIEIIISNPDGQKITPSLTSEGIPLERMDSLDPVPTSAMDEKPHITTSSPRTTGRNTLIRPPTKELPREVDFDGMDDFSFDAPMDEDPVETANMGRNGDTQQHAENGAGTRPDDSSSPAVDQSDVYRVLDHTIIDPYGDIGLYSGTLSLQTKLPHGQGRMRYEDDARVYDGEWSHGRWHGRAKLWNSNGDTYEGDFENDERHGKGTYSWASGRVYVGDFAHDKRHGHGELVFPDGSRYVGSFVQGAREGVGRCDFAEGGAYEGDWKANMFHGDGVCTWPDGRIYRGEFRNNKAHGQGTEIYSDGRVRHAGSWENDAPVV